MWRKFKHLAGLLFLATWSATCSNPDDLMSTVRPVVNPRVLPAAARQFSVILDPTETTDSEFAHIEVPPDLARAVSSRQREYRAGRYCALRAVDLVDPGRTPVSMPKAHHGAPEWPIGLTGSITHAHGFVSAAVARTDDASAIGIDSEPLIPEARLTYVSSAVATASELQRARRAGLPPRLAVTLIFSAKETVFKCLHARVGRVFGFDDVECVDVHPDRGTFLIRAVRRLSADVPEDVQFEGGFEIDDARVHTGMLLPGCARSRNAACRTH